MKGSRNLRTFSTHLPTSLHSLDLSNSGIKSITDCIKCLPGLRVLDLSECKRLVSLPELPSSLHFLKAGNCESLERVSGPLNTPNANLKFTHCFKLDSQARQAIIQQSYFLVREWKFTGKICWGILPGREIPEEFVYRSTRNSVTIPPSFNRVKGCIVISPRLLQDIFRLSRGSEYDRIYFDCKINGNLVGSIDICYKDTIKAEHLIIFGSDLLSLDPSKVSTNIVLECRVDSNKYPRKFKDYPLDIIEWGIQIFTDEKDLSRCESDEVSGEEDDEEGFISEYEEEYDEEGSTSEFGEEDNEEVSKSESGEDSKDKDECIADTYESVSRKRSREKTITNAAMNSTGQELAIQETGQCSSLTGVTEGDDYEFVSRKRPRKTMITSVTTSLKNVIQRLFSKTKEN